MAAGVAFFFSSGALSAQNDLVNRRTGARAVTLNDGRVLLGGGSLYDVIGSGTNLNIVDRAVLADSEVWDPLTGAWTAAGAMSEGRMAFMMTKLSNGSVLAAGGFGVNRPSSIQRRPVQLIAKHYGDKAGSIF